MLKKRESSIRNAGELSNHAKGLQTVRRMLTYGFAQFGQHEEFNVRIEYQPKNEAHQEIQNRTDGHKVEEESHILPNKKCLTTAEAHAPL